MSGAQPGQQVQPAPPVPAAPAGAVARSAASDGLRRWWPDLAVGIGVFAIAAILELDSWTGTRGLVRTAGLLALPALAAGIARARPDVSLALLWLTLAIHAAVGVPIFVLDAAVAVWVAFACARWGGRTTMAAAAASIPVAVGILAVWSLGTFDELTSSLLPRLYERFGLLATLGWWLAAIAALALPWLLGFALRKSDQSRHSAELQTAAQDEATAATLLATAAEERALRDREIADLRGAQARLARDVHDVVGHSLAVILSQAESAQYLSSPDAVRETLANIATTARTSLGDVRRVLDTTRDGSAGSAGPPPRPLDSVVEQVRSAGNDVRPRVIGTPQPLPPELETVAFRVTQEMLTNALRHGDRRAPVEIEQLWGRDQLRIEVRNRVVPPPSPAPGAQAGTSGPARPGTGLAGMRARLESVGGHFDAHRRAEGPVVTFTATAWLPVRASAR